MSILPYGADRGAAPLISDQIEAIERELAGQAGGTVIDLSNASSNGRRPPLIEVIRDGRQIKFYCFGCRRWHYHSAHTTRCAAGCPCPLHADPQPLYGPCWCPRGSGNGLRSSHCTEPTSPLYGRSYRLREVSLARLLGVDAARPPAVPAALAAECAAAGLGATAVRRLWALALEAAERVSQEAGR
jgi:hypothetical protein